MRKRCCCTLNPIYYSSQQIFKRFFIYVFGSLLVVCFLLMNRTYYTLYMYTALDGAQFHANYIHSIENSILIFIFKHTNAHTYISTVWSESLAWNLHKRVENTSIGEQIKFHRQEIHWKKQIGDFGEEFVGEKKWWFMCVPSSNFWHQV